MYSIKCGDISITAEKISVREDLSVIVVRQFDKGQLIKAGGCYV